VNCTKRDELHEFKHELHEEDELHEWVRNG